MNALAYVIAIMNPLILNLKDANFRIGDLSSLANDIHNLPKFSSDAFKENRYKRVGNKGIYLSENLQDFLNNGQGDQDEEGYMVILDFESKKRGSENDPGSHAYLLHFPDFNNDDIKNAHRYIENMHKNRITSRSLQGLQP